MTRKIFLMAIGAVAAWIGGIAPRAGLADEKTEPEWKSSADESSSKKKIVAAKAVGRSSMNNY